MNASESTALAGIEIEVDGEECHFIAAGTPLKMVMDIACKKPIQGRTVSVKKYPVPGTDCYSQDREHALLLCEVQVWGTFCIVIISATIIIIIIQFPAAVLISPIHA